MGEPPWNLSTWGTLFCQMSIKVVNVNYMFFQRKSNELQETTENHCGRVEMKSKGNAILVEWPGYEAWIADFLFSWVYMEVHWCSILRLVRLMVLEALCSKLRFRIICRMKSHPGPLVLPARVVVCLCGGNLVRCVSCSSLPVLNTSLFASLFYTLSQDLLGHRGTFWLDQWAQGRCWRIKDDAVIWKTSAVLHFSFIFVCCMHFIFTTLLRGLVDIVFIYTRASFFYYSQWLFVSLSQWEFIWSYKNKCIIFTLLYLSFQGQFCFPIASSR